MRTLPCDYILTTYSVTMFGDSASLHQMKIDADVAKMLVGPATKIVATRPSHENLAKATFGDMEVIRYAEIAPDSCVILIHYRGAPVSEAGEPHADAVVSFYLIETEPYIEL